MPKAKIEALIEYMRALRYMEDIAQQLAVEDRAKLDDAVQAVYRAALAIVGAWANKTAI